MDETIDMPRESPEEGEPAAQAEPEMLNGVAGSVEGEDVIFSGGLAGSVNAQKYAHINNSLMFVANAGQDMAINDSLAVTGVAGRDLETNYSGMLMLNVGANAEMMNGGALMTNVGGNLEINNGGALVTLAGGQVSVQHGSLGVVLAGSVNLGEDSKVLLNTPQAIALGAAFGAVVAVVGWLLRRRR